MNDILNRIALMLGAPLVLGILVYLMITTRAEKVPVEKLSEEQIIERELEFLYKNTNIVSIIRDVIIRNKDKINADNCIAVLEDLDKDGSLDVEALLTTQVSYKDVKNHQLIVYYNACNMEFTENKNITFALTTSKLVNILYNKDGVDYFRGIMYELSDINQAYKEAIIPLEFYLK